jgi:hypothetical protein
MTLKLKLTFDAYAEMPDRQMETAANDSMTAKRSSNAGPAGHDRTEAQTRCVGIVGTPVSLKPPSR